MKPGVFSQVFIQLVFAVKSRECLLLEPTRQKVFSYLSGIATGMKHKSIIVNGYTDHVHIFLGWNPSISISDTVHDLKRNSSLFVNDNKQLKGRFSWQEGYGVFSYAKEDIEKVYQYILNQEVHHKKKTFQEEYIEFLSSQGIEYDERFLFDFF